MRFALWLGLLLLAGACAASDGESNVQPRSLPASFQNQGGSMEGHTPRRFQGSGVGLFAGDNLNPGFPEGEGIHLWLTFDLGGVVEAPSQALISSDVLTVRGTPFEDLGSLQAEPVTYESFSSALFDLPANGPAVPCERTNSQQIGETGIECDVTDSVVQALVDGQTSLQYRIRFQEQGDSDGEQDLALFFLTDSNTNEPGIFRLELQ